ncbi:MAG: PD-(D/E)XK nuclease family protein [Candidatus Omnitrophica bacterium]|nr:PD-(D/E)XK nuclease family protein [Candidatus Omnitrophota bacterium]
MKDKSYLVVFPFYVRDRTSYIAEKFFKDTKDFSCVLHLSSKWTKIDDFRTRLYLCKKTPIIPPSSFSLKAFAAKIVQEQSQYRLISGVEQFLILLKLCLPMAEKIEMEPVSLATKLKSFVKDFKVSHEKLDFGFLFDTINSYQWKYDENKELVIMACRIMEEYQNFLVKNNLADEDDLYSIATSYVGKMKFDTVLLEGILEFIPSQRNFLKGIARNSHKFICVYQFDQDAPFDAKNFILKPNFDFLKSITDEIVVVEDKKKVCDECVVYNFPTPDEEIKGIGQMIIEKMAEKNDINWEDFLVVFPQMLSYRELVHRIFTRMKIPFCMTPGYILSQDPSIVAIISFLNWLETPLWWELLMGLFTSPFFTFDFDEALEFSKKARTDFKGFGFFPQEAWLKQWNNWKKIKKAGDIMQAIQDTMHGWINRLTKALKEIGWKCFDIEGKKALLELFEELKSDIQTDRQTFVRIFKNILDLIEVERSKGSGVKVMGILDSIGLETKFVFIGGATDDALPQTCTSEEFFLPDRLKEKLGLATYELKLARERLDIYRLRKSHERIVFSYPSKVSGMQKGKSIMLYEIKELPYNRNYYFSVSESIFSLKPDIEKFRKKFVHNGVVHLSVSELDKMARCPYEFYLNCVEGLEPYTCPEIEEVPEFWGVLLHCAAEKAAADFKGKIMDEDSIEKQHKKFCELVDLFLQQPSLVSGKYFYKIPPVIRSFLEKRKKSVFDSFKNALAKHIGHRIIEIEKKVKVRIGSMEIVGKFDRIEETQTGNYEIIDFKSGKAPELNKKYPGNGNCLELKNLELPLYCLIFYKFFGEKSDVFVWSLNFDRDIFEISYPQIPGFLEIFEKELEILAQKLINGEFNFAVGGKNCFGCAFSSCCIIKGESDE